MHIPQGFKFAACESGIKKKGLDLGLIYSENPALAAGVFTKNLVKAAPVLLGQEILSEGEEIKAILVNSGCANACTGRKGLEDAREILEALAKHLNCKTTNLLPASTGVIGERLPKEKIISSLPRLITLLSADNAEQFARAIMTTDAFPKLSSRKIKVRSGEVTILGIAKGAGMICPNMATMLAFILTDAHLPLDFMQETLKKNVAKSFNRISVDGDTSTNDTVYFLANKTAVKIETQEEKNIFNQALYEICYELAKLIVKDGEGATKLVHLKVINAANEEKALKIAKTIANSLLSKTAFFGEDPNWGRFLAAMGRAGVSFSPETTDIYINQVKIVANGLGEGKEQENLAHSEMKKKEFTLTIDLKEGNASAEYLTCDLSYDYVKINAEYRT